MYVFIYIEKLGRGSEMSERNAVISIRINLFFLLLLIKTFY
jgi:hypothetical protein